MSFPGSLLSLVDAGFQFRHVFHGLHKVQQRETDGVLRTGRNGMDLVGQCFDEFSRVNVGIINTIFLFI